MEGYSILYGLNLCKILLHIIDLGLEMEAHRRPERLRIAVHKKIEQPDVGDNVAGMEVLFFKLGEIESENYARQQTYKINFII